MIVEKYSRPKQRKHEHFGTESRHCTKDSPDLQLADSCYQYVVDMLFVPRGFITEITYLDRPLWGSVPFVYGMAQLGILMTNPEELVSFTCAVLKSGSVPRSPMHVFQTVQILAVTDSGRL